MVSNAQDLLEAWIDAVEYRGLNEVRKIPAYHDEH